MGFRSGLRAYHQLGQIEAFAGDLESARDHYQRCLALARDFLGAKPVDPLRKQLLAASYAGLGYVQLNGLETDKAVQNYRAAIQALGAEPTGIEANDRILTVLYAAWEARSMKSDRTPSLIVLRDLGLCYESLGNVQRRIAMSHSVSPAERQTAQAGRRTPMVFEELWRMGRVEQARRCYSRERSRTAQDGTPASKRCNDRNTCQNTQWELRGNSVAAIAKTSATIGCTADSGTKERNSSPGHTSG